MPTLVRREMLRRAVLYQFSLRLLCIQAARARNLSDEEDDSTDSDSTSGLDNVVALAQVLTGALETLTILDRITNTRYLTPRHDVIKIGQLRLLTAFSQAEADLRLFLNMVRVSPYIFRVLVALIEDDPVFHNNSQNEQRPVDEQLAVTLYRMGRYGNGASVDDVARFAGIAHGTVQLFMQRCFIAIERLHPLFVCPLTAGEKEREKEWIDKHLGFKGLWREGYLMYDGTIVPLSEKPALNGQSYYTRKSNYGLNVQIGNIPSNLRIVDYSHGYTGSAHDSSAFEWTAAYRHPELLFQGDEFAFGDSAYAVTPRMIPIHRSPAADLPANRLFDKTLSGLRVRSEHCNGSLKGRWQCLRGLRSTIRSNREHVEACRWVTIAIILHNIVVEFEGTQGAEVFMGAGRAPEDEHEQGEGMDFNGDDEDEGEEKRQRLVDEINAAHA